MQLEIELPDKITYYVVDGSLMTCTATLVIPCVEHVSCVAVYCTWPLPQPSVLSALDSGEHESFATPRSAGDDTPYLHTSVCMCVYVCMCVCW